MPVDLVALVDSIPSVESVVYNQIIFVPNQKRELALLDKKKNRHASMPNPSNLIAVEDIKRVQEVIARENKQLVYTHYNLIMTVKTDTDIQKCTNHLENAFGRMGIHISKLGFLKNLVMLIWKGSQGTVSKTEDRLIEQVINEYYEAYFTTKRVSNLCFNTFYEFSTERLPKICEENGLHGIDLSSYNYLLKDFYKGGSHDVTLNENMDSSLFDETFIVFEIDSIKDDPLLFPLVTLIIMDVFLQKMRIKKNRKMLIIEEAWKAIASPMMAEYIKYLYKTARKFWASVGVVTQEIQDIIGSEIVKEAIINNSDVVMLLDQSKFKERFDTIKAILGLTDVDCKKIFTINRLENKEGRSFFREVFIRRGQTSNVYGVEEPHECYMTYTTERAEKEALKLYKRELRCNHQQAIEAYCRDWDASGISKSLAFAQKVNQAGRVLRLSNTNK